MGNVPNVAKITLMQLFPQAEDSGFSNGLSEISSVISSAEKNSSPLKIALGFYL